MNEETIDPYTENVLYEIWFSFAERIFKRVVKIAGLDEEQEKALRLVALRPNDFLIMVK